MKKILPIREALLTLLFPIIGLYLGVANFRFKTYRNLLYIVAFIFGWTFVVKNEGLDSYRYVEYFYRVSNLDWKTFYKENLIWFASESSLDLAKPILAYFSSYFSGSHRFFYGILAVIFTHFYIKSILAVVRENREKWSVQVLLLIMIFVFVLNPITNVNGFRFYTSVWIFFYAVTGNLKSGRVAYLFLLSCFFHVSFLIPVVVYYVYNLWKPRMIFVLIILIASFVFGRFVDMEKVLISFGVFGPASLYEHALRYVDKSGTIASGNSTYYIGVFQNLCLEISILLGYLRFLEIKEYRCLSNEQKYGLKWSIFFYSFANVASGISSGGRFFTIAYLISVSFLISLGLERNCNFRRMGLLIPFCAFLIGSILPLRLLLDELNPLILIMTPLAIVFENYNLAQIIFN
jgi:hypothetical protein